MKLRYFVVDAFTDRPFAGNPAGVCPLDAWIPDETMQAVAFENNLSETAFFVRRADGDHDLRWFTPEAEIDLCGHATLASAHVVLRHLEPERASVAFHTRSGQLGVARDGDLLVMDFPATSLTPASTALGDALTAALGAQPTEVFHARSYLMAVFPQAGDVAALEPDFPRLAEVDATGTIATASEGAGDLGADFVSRFFAPRVGVDEDPVTGSAHCALAPYWARRLGRESLRARQISRRGGDVGCTLRGDRVELRGRAVLYLRGEIELAV